MFKVGQIVLIAGHPTTYEIRGVERYSGSIPVKYSIMGTNGRGFKSVEASKLKLATDSEIEIGRNLTAAEDIEVAAKLKIRAKKRLMENMQRHSGRLIREGIMPTEANLERATEFLDRSRRVARCYSCSSTLDSNNQNVCGKCNWIICTCGACGCGHPSVVRGWKPTEPSESRSEFSDVSGFSGSHETPPAGSESIEFSDFATALAYVKSNEGYTLSKKGESRWLASKKAP